LGAGKGLLFGYGTNIADLLVLLLLCLMPMLQVLPLLQEIPFQEYCDAGDRWLGITCNHRWLHWMHRRVHEWF
jgi:hypothetical protein